MRGRAQSIFIFPSPSPKYEFLEFQFLDLSVKGGKMWQNSWSFFFGSTFFKSASQNIFIFESASQRRGRGGEKKIFSYRSFFFSPHPHPSLIQGTKKNFFFQDSWREKKQVVQIVTQFDKKQQQQQQQPNLTQPPFPNKDLSPYLGNWVCMPRSKNLKGKGGGGRGGVTSVCSSLPCKLTKLSWFFFFGAKQRPIFLSNSGIFCGKLKKKTWHSFCGGGRTEFFTLSLGNPGTFFFC